MITTPTIVQVNPAADVQAALNAAAAGDEIRFGPGTYTAPTAAGWTLPKPVSLVGPSAGYGDQTIGATLAPYVDPVNGTKNSSVLTIASNRVRVESLAIAAAALPAAGTGNGIQFKQTGAGSVIYFGVILRDLNIANMGNDGIHFESTGSNFLNDVLIDKVESDTNRGKGFHLEHCGSVMLTNCLAIGNYKNGAYLTTQGNARLYGCYLQGNSKAGNGYAIGAQLAAVLSHNLVISGCAFEDFDIDANTVNALTLLNCRSPMVYGCQFGNFAYVPTHSTQSILLAGGTSGAFIGPNAHDMVGRTIFIDPATDNNGNTIMQQDVASKDATSVGLADYGTGSGKNKFNTIMLSSSTVTDRRLSALRLPWLNVPGGSIGSEADGDTPDAKFEGALVYSQFYHAPGFYNGSAWSFANNCPMMTTAERDSRTWAPGSVIVNTTDHKLQIKRNAAGATWVDVTTSAAPDS